MCLDRLGWLFQFCVRACVSAVEGSSPLCFHVFPSLPDVSILFPKLFPRSVTHTWISNMFFFHVALHR